jgi:two-component system, OmpR family, alkaline phosphatase synthesis response regulator PhoP
LVAGHQKEEVRMSAVRKGKVLLIEDDSGFRRTYSDVLIADGYTVITAEDGEQGLAMVRTEKPDVVLLDLILPKLAGFEVLKSIRADAGIKDTIVIIMSVLGEQTHIKKGLELGANDYTVKGFYKPNEVLGKIQTLLTQPGVKTQGDTYNLFIKENRGDVAKLKSNTGWAKPLTCAVCNEEMQLVLIPDYSRSDAHWFSAHFACPVCGRTF